MTIQGALLNALSSLAAEQRQSMIIANNVANANTVGYVRREMPRTEALSGGEGQGVATGVIQRAGDAALAAASRAADGDEAYGTRMTDILKSLTATVGQPSDANSLPSLMGAFQTALTTLSASPSNAVAQSEAVNAAKDLVSGLHDMDAAVGKARSQADAAIASDVDSVNASLTELASVDREMARAAARGTSTAEMEDRRDTLLADISAKLPVRVFDNGPGKLVVMTDQGTTLYDSGTVHKLVFTPAAGLSSSGGLTNAIYVETPAGQLQLGISSTGSIAASLALRDGTLPKYGQMLDEVAGNLITAFQTADSTTAGTNPGIFTDNGSYLSSSSPYPAGLASRVDLNAAVEATPSLLRDGAASTTAGQASDNTTILAFLDAMSTPASYDTTTGLPGKMNLTEATSQIAGLIQSEHTTWSTRADTRSQLALEARQDLTNKTGVNVDEELQRLMLVQQTYAASAQVIQSVSKMLDDLISIR